ncbi:MAG TPA: hypothetical protein VMU88_03175, partial [bacterium]|nr:hypothetical protein [bacterium]
MRKLKSKIMVALGCGFLALPAFFPSRAYAIFERGGNVGVGARAMGMGGAFDAVADDPSAAYWNPAGLTQLEVPTLLMMYGSLFNDKTRTVYGSFQYPLPNDFHLALSVNDSFFADTDGALQGEYQASVAVPLPFVPQKRLSVGFNFRYLNAALGSGQGSAQGVGVDLGFLYKEKLQEQLEWSAGLVFDDISTTARFDSGVEESLPTIITPALALRFEKDTTISLDLPWTLSGYTNQTSDLEFRGGLEHWFFDGKLGLRVGYLSLATLPGEITLGASYRTYQWFVDYAYINHSNDLGNSHRIEGGWYFDTVSPDFKPEPRPYVIETFVSDEKIYFKWDIPQGSQADGYYVYLKTDADSAFHRAKQEPLTTQYCLLRGAVNGTAYHVYITSVVDGKEKLSSNEFIATPKPMAQDADHYYQAGVQYFNQNNLSAALYAARKAEEL